MTGLENIDFNAVPVYFSWIVPAIMAGSAALQAWMASRKNKESKNAASPEDLKRFAGESYGRGVRAFGRAEQTLEPVGKFWDALLRGDPEAVNQAIAPARSRIISQYDSARRQVAEFGGRGGGRNEFLAELPFREAGEISRLTQEARTGAARELTGLGSIYGDLAGGQLNLAGQAWSGSVTSGLEARRLSDARNAALGQGIGNLLAMLAAGMNKGG